MSDAGLKRPSEQEMREALTLRPEGTCKDMSRVWLHVTADHDTAILFERNGHTIGWLSAWEVVQLAARVSKGTGQ